MLDLRPGCSSLPAAAPMPIHPVTGGLTLACVPPREPDNEL